MNELSLEDYISATNSASTRARRVVYAFCFASILAFMAFWNSRNESWFNSRYSIIQEIYRVDFDTTRTEKKGAMPNNAEKAKLDEFKVSRSIVTKKQTEDLLEIYQNLKKEIYLIRVPILGVSFDVNDLGIFSGLTFTMLLTLFWFTLEREEENLKLTFEYAERKNKLKDVYTYLSMGQVLTIPQKDNASVSKFWQHLPKAIYMGPWVVSILIFINDIGTLESGFVLNFKATIILIITSVIFLTIISILTIFCLHRAIEVEKLWNLMYTKMQKLNKSNNGVPDIEIPQTKQIAQ